MNVLLVNDTLKLGGTQAHLIQLSQYLIKEGHNVTLIAKEGEMSSRLPKEVRFLNSDLEGKNPLKVAFQSLKILRVVTKDHINVIHSHFILILTFLWMIARIKRIKVVCTVHKMLKDTYWAKFPGAVRFAKILIDSFADDVIVLSESSRMEVQLPKKRLHVIPNGINLKLMDRKEISHQNSSEFRLIYTGRLIKHKNIDHLIDIIKLLNETDSEKIYTLNLVGSGSEMENLQERVRSLNLDSLVTFLGYVENVAEFLNEADAFVITSLSEGVSYSLLEVISVAKPVFGYNVPGVNELVLNGENGVLVPFGDKCGLANEIMTFSADEKLMNKLSMGSYSLAKEKYSMDLLGSQLVSLYSN